MNVISLDENRVKILDDCVEKQSDYKEALCLRKAKEIISNFNLFEINNKKYKLNVPEIYDYNNGIIVMEKCQGDNLEISLREMENHKNSAEYNNKLLQLFINKEFYWHDYAPRNILIDKGEIWIMDFERGLSDKCELPLYLLNNVYEEYSAFLLPEEREVDLDKIINNSNNSMINVKDIKSQRFRIISRMMYGEKEQISIKEFSKVIKSILCAEEPYIENDQIIYPLLELEDYVAEYGREKYAEKVLRKYYGKDRKV